MDDLPALEADPRLFDLTHLAAVATDSAHAPAGKRARGGGAKRGGAAAARGRKRARGETEADVEEEEDEESDFSHDSDESDVSDDEGVDDDGLAAAAASSAAAASPGYAEAALSHAALSADPTQRRVWRVKKEKDIDGVARAMFPVVQTIHANASLGREIDVKTVARRSLNAPTKVRFTVRNPRGVAIVYNTGNFICMGGKSTVDMLTIARKVARKVQRIPEYNNVGFHNFRVNNISAHAAFGFKLSLRALADDPAYMDYTEYEPEQWKGLYYRLPVDPTKTMADLVPSVAEAARARAALNGGAQYSTDEFLQQGVHALDSNRLSYYSTTGTAGGRAPKSAAAAAAAKTPLRLPPSLNGQILTATIYANGRLTLTGVRREQDIRDGFLRLFHILKPFALSTPPEQPPVPPPYPRIFMPGQRKLIKQEARRDAEYAASMLGGDVKPPPLQQSAMSSAFAPAPLMPAAPAAAPVLLLPLPAQPLKGTFAVKAEPGAAAAAVVATTAEAAPAVKTEPNGVFVKSEPGAAVDMPGGESLHTALVIDGLPDDAGASGEAHEDVEWE